MQMLTAKCGQCHLSYQFHDYDKEICPHCAALPVPGSVHEVVIRKRTEERPPLAPQIGMQAEPPLVVNG
jgi:hypothetical protein